MYCTSSPHHHHWTTTTTTSTLPSVRHTHTDTHTAGPARQAVDIPRHRYIPKHCWCRRLPARPPALHFSLALTSVQQHHTHAAAGDDGPNVGEGLSCSTHQFLFEGTKKKDDSLQGRGRERDTFTSPNVSPITELGKAEQAAGRREPAAPLSPAVPPSGRGRLGRRAG
ncbi:hypothetical protein E2C01_063634 [Portunus trituberculatus]|uniref:Uncharacterized protein n=1 Tax=Portunus trituberculatus TaxID=210409 RepID=A0A5B7HAZ4_PORTR|nr:hypothetical protein [Portunus trituberculatus]